MSPDNDTYRERDDYFPELLDCLERWGHHIFRNGTDRCSVCGDQQRQEMA